MRYTLVALMMAAASVHAAGPGDTPLDCTIEPKRIARIGSPDEGIIQDLLVERGDVVAKGEVLAVLDSKMEVLAADLARLQASQDVEVRSRRARLDYQRDETKRAEALFGKRMMSDAERAEVMVQEDLAELELESAALRRKVAMAELAISEARLERRSIRSPVNGVVTEVSKAPGEYVHEQTPLLVLAQIEDLNVEVFVPLSFYGHIKVGQKVVVEPVKPIGGQYEATVAVIDRVYDAASGTFGVRLHLPNQDAGLPAGIRCTVRFPHTSGGAN